LAWVDPITLNQLTTGIPALNAKLQELGIDEPNGSISATYTPRYDQRHPAPPGFHYVLAAKRLPNGKILGFSGALKHRSLPACLPYNSRPFERTVEQSHHRSSTTIGEPSPCLRIGSAVHRTHQCQPSASR
jgi:hypothetical protein